jgi:hypothetical protein
MIVKKIIYGCEERGDADVPYLTRYTLINTKLFQVCLHIFHRSDADDLHDHPWNFLSIILWRGYNEVTEQQCYVCNKLGYSNCSYRNRVKQRKLPGMFLFRKAQHKHRVELVNGKPAMSLVIMGKRKREWGFWVNGVWEYWQHYFIKKRC